MFINPAEYLHLRLLRERWTLNLTNWPTKKSYDSVSNLNHDRHCNRNWMSSNRPCRPQPDFLKSASIYLFICTLNTQRGIKLVLFWHKLLVLHAAR